MKFISSCALINCVCLSLMLISCTDNIEQSVSEKNLGLAQFYFDKGRYNDVFVEVQKLSDEEKKTQLQDL